ncbi:hypothetical protein JTB14_031979 [Gonioctena quinquepunctata]|nr:hypothetical protein JTB14_031979 [Gonioctena quinquepunctata]
MPLLQASLRCEVGKSENNLENFAGSLKRPRGEYSKLTSDITSNIKKTAYQLSSGIIQAETVMAKNEALQNQQNAETSWRTVNYNEKRKTKSSGLVGTHNRRNPGTWPEILKAFLEPKFPEVVCEPWESKSPESHQCDPIESNVQRFSFPKEVLPSPP